MLQYVFIAVQCFRTLPTRPTKQGRLFALPCQAVHWDQVSTLAMCHALMLRITPCLITQKHVVLGVVVHHGNGIHHSSACGVGNLLRTRVAGNWTRATRGDRPSTSRVVVLHADVDASPSRCLPLLFRLPLPRGLLHRSAAHPNASRQAPKCLVAVRVRPLSWTR